MCANRLTCSAVSVALREQPRQSHLCRCCIRLGGNGLDLVDDAQVALEVLPGRLFIEAAKELSVRAR